MKVEVERTFLILLKSFFVNFLTNGRTMELKKNSNREQLRQRLDIEEVCA